MGIIACDGVSGAVAVGSVLEHGLEIEFVGSFRGQRSTNIARGVPDQKGHFLLGGEFGSDDEITLVFSGFVVHDHEKLPLFERLDGVWDGCEGHGGGRWSGGGEVVSEVGCESRGRKVRRLVRRTKMAADKKKTNVEKRPFFVFLVLEADFFDSGRRLYIDGLAGRSSHLV